jgi:hypothetical protein
MVRWFLLASLMLWLGTGFQHGWILVRWDKMFEDLHIPIDKLQPEQYLK